jgi:hypothetical protein
LILKEVYDNLWAFLLVLYRANKFVVFLIAMLLIKPFHYLFYTGFTVFGYRIVLFEFNDEDDLLIGEDEFEQLFMDEILVKLFDH